MNGLVRVKLDFYSETVFSDVDDDVTFIELNVLKETPKTFQLDSSVVRKKSLDKLEAKTQHICDDMTFGNIYLSMLVIDTPENRIKARSVLLKELGVKLLNLKQLSNKMDCKFTQLYNK